MKRSSQFRSVHVLSALVIAVIVCAVAVVACGTKSVELDEDFQKLLTYKFGDSREPLMVIQDHIRESHGDAAVRLNLERQLAQLIRTESTWECNDFACRQLRVVGTKESVSTLATLLTDEKMSDMARYALELNRDPSVDKALRKALSTAQGKTLIGIVNSIGERRDKGSVEDLKKLITSTDEGVASAARDALAKIGM